jgi:hypothetical protein
VAPGEAYRRKLLRALGIEVCEVDAVPVRAYIFNAADQNQASAVVGVPQGGGTQMVEAVRYDGKIDSGVVQALTEQITRAWVDSQTVGARSNRPTLVRSQWDSLHDALKRVSQYSSPDVKLVFQEVPINKLVALTRFVREYKYAQIDHLLAMYKACNVDTFSPAVAQFGDGQSSMVTPPVVERSGDRFILIEGTTRAVYFRDNGLESMWGVVAQNVADPLPAERVDFEKVRVVGRTLEADIRYPSFNYGAFRHIETSVHTPGSLS